MIDPFVWQVSVQKYCFVTRQEHVF